MATGLVAVPAVNGAVAPSASDLAEYQKLIKLHDAVFSGQHPKLKLSNSTTTPSHAAATNAQAVHANNAVYANFDSNNGNGHVNADSQSRPNGQLMPAALQGFDPKLMEKSALLIATEQNISRSDLEAVIQQELKRRSTMWPKLDRENILPEFDVDDILSKAQESVRPVLIDHEKLAAKEKSPAKSVDDQSYYSSQAHDDEPDFDANDQRAQNASKPCVYFFKGKCNRGGACKFSHDPAFAAQLKPNLANTEPDRPFTNTPGGHPNKKQKRDDSRYGQPGGFGNDFGEDFPASAKRRADEQYQRDLARAAQAPNPAHSFDDVQYVPPPPGRRVPVPQDRRFSGRGMTPTRDVAVVRSTISSPLAPQPARVSPLAMKGPSYIEKVRMDAPHGPSPHLVATNGRQSPQVNQQTLNRKRRRDTNTNNGPEPANVRRRMASPEVRIKDEPVSPKPVDAVPRYVQREEVARRPVDVDAYSPRGGRNESRPVREVHYVDDPGFRVSSPVRVVSRAELRHEVRREPELRRVVSERQMVRAESPPMSAREHAYYSDGRPMQAGPRELYVTRSDADLHSAYRASVAPTGPPSEYADEQRRVRSPIQQPSSMAPPPVRRIVRDQYGNEYFERIIQEPPRYSVAPEPRYAGEPAYIGRPASRVGSVVPESARPYHDGPPVQRRQEQEPTSPRYTEYPAQSARAPTVGPTYQPEYAGERSHVVREYPREGRYERVIQEPPRQAYAERPREVYYDDVPRDGTYRVQSVRPEAPRYVEADDRYARQGSVRPPASYDRPPQTMAPPPPPSARYEYADGRQMREYTVTASAPQYIE